MTSLRTAAIRLAHQHPGEVRKALLEVLAGEQVMVRDSGGRQIPVDSDQAREALTGVTPADRLNVLFPLFGRALGGKPVTLTAQEFSKLQKAGVIPRPTQPERPARVNLAAIQRAYDKLLEAAAKETLEAAEGLIDDAQNSEDYDFRGESRDMLDDPGTWTDLAEGSFEARAKEFKPLMQALGIRRDVVVTAIAEMAAG